LNRKDNKREKSWLETLLKLSALETVPEMIHLFHRPESFQNKSQCKKNYHVAKSYERPPLNLQQPKSADLYLLKKKAHNYLG